MTYPASSRNEDSGHIGRVQSIGAGRRFELRAQRASAASQAARGLSRSAAAGRAGRSASLDRRNVGRLYDGGTVGRVEAVELVDDRRSSHSVIK